MLTSGNAIVLQTIATAKTQNYTGCIRSGELGNVDRGRGNQVSGWTFRDSRRAKSQTHWRKLMLRALVKTCAFASILSLPISLAAQQVVHALTGTVSSINKAGQTVAVLQDVGGSGVFQKPANPKAHVSLDKKIESGTIAAD